MITFIISVLIVLDLVVFWGWVVVSNAVYSLYMYTMYRIKESLNLGDWKRQHCDINSNYETSTY